MNRAAVKVVTTPETPAQEFEHGIPIPRRIGASMKDGDSKFFTEQQEAKSFYNTLTSCLRNSNSKAVIRKMDHGWRVWMVAR